MRYYGVIGEVTRHNTIDEPVLFKHMMFVSAREAEAEKLAGTPVFVANSFSGVFYKAERAGYRFRWMARGLDYYWVVTGEPGGK